MSEEREHEAPPKPRRCAGLSERLVAGERVLLDPRSNRMHQLNVTATFVWERCDGQSLPSEIATELAETFDVELEIASRDVDAILAQFASLKLLLEESS